MAATVTTFKGVVHLTEAEYTSLVTNGSITKDGQTLTYDAGTIYVTDAVGVTEYSSGSTQWDTTPTSASTKPVTSGGIYTALSGKQDTLPTTSTAGKVLKSTSTAGTVEWGDASSATSTDVQVDSTSITSGGVADLKTINGNYNASSNKLATASDLPASITITTTSGSEAVSDGTNTLSFGSNAFTSTTIPTTTDSVTSGSSAALTSGGAYTALSNKAAVTFRAWS